ncbi:Trk system potassium transporter TrkA [Halobacteriales archaeon QH_10_67_13]|nr:MAG: Trk system potassium transporter TrkA [Halobacteriales archaeon QH_10_67_13]
MRVIIVGAGQVGTAIAGDLAGDHDVVVIDTDESRVDELQYEYDVLTVAGDGASLPVLERAGVEDADRFIACTDEDRTNLVACGAARTICDPFTIARTKNVDYLRTWERTNDAFGVDYVVCSTLLAAETIVRVVGLPAAVNVKPYAGGLVYMAEFEINEASPIVGQTIAEADRFDSLTFAGLLRDGDAVLPGGDTRFEPEDRVVVIGTPRSVQLFAADAAPEKTPDEADDIVVVGGSEIGYHTARLLGKRRFTPRLVESDPDRARELAERLPDTLVMENDATDAEFLDRERIDEADVLVTTLGTDEQNLLTALLAKRLGCRQIIALVDNAEYVPLFEAIGVDVTVNPRQTTAEEILRFSFESAAENLTVLEGHQAEVLELELEADSPLAGRTIAGLDRAIPGSFVVGAITRDRAYVEPRGETTLEAGDRIVVLADTDSVEGFIERT